MTKHEQAASSVKRSKILFIITVLDRMGGAEKNLVDIVRNLNRQRYEPYVLAFRGGELTNMLEREGVKVSVNNLRKIFSVRGGREILKLAGYLKHEKINVIVTYHHDADIIGSIAGKLAGIPVISSRRDMGFQLQSKHIWFYRLFSWLFARFIVVSDAVGRCITKREWINSKKIVTIHNGLLVENYENSVSRSSLCNELGVESQKLIIGMVASFRPIKGHTYLVEAVRMLAKLNRDLQVIVVGYNDTAYFKEVYSQIRRYDLEAFFVFTGNRADVPRLLSLFDVFVISSLNEGFSNAIIEAMAAGVPVVASDSGGNREAVEHGETGLLYPPCDSKALAECLHKLLESPRLRKKFGSEGKRKVRVKFRLEDMIRKSERVLEEVMRDE